jgi:Na+-transporting NADH:ubiquinone oxidoreductase subunit C
MAINKETNGYTFGFAIALVAVVGTVLALLAMGLKPMKDRNAEVKKQMEILSALMDLDAAGINRQNAPEEFKKFINLEEAVVLDMNGNVKEGVEAFDVDIQTEYKDKTLAEKDKNYPLFVAKKDGKTQYVIPVIGKGLWGPIWGNICLDEDMATIVGASFGHKGETPGLGAEIQQKFFIDRWIGEKITDESGAFLKFEVVKDGTGSKLPQKVDGITGGTITSKGVEEMANRCLSVYANYFKNLKNQKI